MPAGLPFFFSGSDVDFMPLPPFAAAVPADESPIDMEMVLRLARLPEEQPDIRRRMRQYAEEHCAWQGKMRRLHAFMGEVLTARNGSLPPQRPALEVEGPTPATVRPLLTLPASDAPSAEALTAGLHSLLRQQYRSGPALCRDVAVAGPADWLDQVRRTWEAISPAYADVPTLLTLPQAEGAGPCACWNAAAEAPGTEGYAPQWLLPLLAGDVLREDMLEAPQQAVRHQPEISCISARTSGPDGSALEAPRLPHAEAGPGRGGSLSAHPPFPLAGRGRHAGIVSRWASRTGCFWLGCLEEGAIRRNLPRTGIVRAVPAPQPLAEAEEMEALSQMVIRRTSIFPASSVIKAHEILAGTVSPPFARRPRTGGP